ncbi:MAG TPA: hypothetical protein VGB94_13365 [Acidobacteriaceae bacterium]
MNDGGAEMNQKDDFEQQVREGLRAGEAPVGFADRLMQRIAEREAAAKKPVVLKMPKPKFWQANAQKWAIAATLLAVAGGGAVFQQKLEQRRAERAAGEQATKQVMLALQITSNQLQHVNEKINGE